MNGKKNRVRGCYSRAMGIRVSQSINDKNNLLNIPTSNMTKQQKSLLNFFNKKHNSFPIIGLKQEHFDNGTFRIKNPGKYVLLEDINFNPNEDNDFFPTQQQISSGLYPELMNGPYHLGFFAAIAVESENVIIDLNNKTLKQSEKHAFQQRFYSNIELANSPFIPKQGPGDFKGNTTYKPAKNVLVMNGKLGKSSHHGIHSNKADNVILHNLDITNFEVAGIALNGSSNSILSNINIHDNTQNIPILSTYSQARFIRKHLDSIPASSSINILGTDVTRETIKNNLNNKLNETFTAFKNGEQLPENIFKNNEAEKGYDGNVYGIVLNVNGVVINNFIQERTPSMVGNNNIYLNNIKINNLSSNPLEIIGISDNSGECAINEAYGKNVQSGPVGGIIQFENIVTDKINIDGTYIRNVLSDAQFIVSKYSSKPKVTQCILDWVSEGTNLKEKAIDEEQYYYVTGRDSMSHTMKGNIGLFISGGINIKGDNVYISNIKNLATPKSFTSNNICPTLRSNQPFVATNNITVSSNNININNVNILNTQNLHTPL